MRVGVSDGQFVEVREGLEEGAVVITGTEIPGARAGAGRRARAPPVQQPLHSRSSSAASAERRWPTRSSGSTTCKRSYALGDVTVHALRGVDLEIAKGSMLASWAPRAPASRRS